jgi:hypothetical protein
MIDCEVCLGRSEPDADPEVTLTFADDATGEAVKVRMCRKCVGAIYATMLVRYKEAAAANNAEVAAFCEWMGIEFPEARSS